MFISASLCQHQNGTDIPRTQGSRKEEEALLYHQAARFAVSSQQATRMQGRRKAIFTTENELSTYRFMLDQLYHIAVVGEQPPEELEQLIQRTLATGEPVVLRTEIVRQLNQRRKQATELEPWVEGHYRPGRRLE